MLKNSLKIKNLKLKIEENHSLLNNSQNIRPCPECGMKSLKGMPGGRDSTCKNCGYKDPCCYD